MKLRTGCFVLALSFALVLHGEADAGTITFDDATTSVKVPVTDGYEGLDWDNFWVVDPVAQPYDPSGYLNGLVSGKYVAFNGSGSPASISGAIFDVVGGYFTAAWRDDLTVTVQGYLAGTEVHSTSFEVDVSGPVYVSFGWSGIDRLRVNTEGGSEHYGSGYQVVIDNLGITVVPIPPAVWIGSCALGGFVLLRRGRRHLRQ